MKNTMRIEGGIGLAAPQVGVNKRLFVIEIRPNDRYGSLPSIPFGSIYKSCYSKVRETYE